MGVAARLRPERLQVEALIRLANRMVMFVDVSEQDAHYLAINATEHARLTMPRVSGATARHMQPIWDQGYFGIYFPDPHTWYMEHGTKPFTMRSLANKTIPMWVSDLDGSIRAKDPKAKVRRTEDGRLQVLITTTQRRLVIPQAVFRQALK